MIAIVDYGMGNLSSVSQALQRLGQEYTITSDPKEIEQSDQLILPGVGAFGDAMFALKRLGLAKVIQAEGRNGKPILGICLGMQLLFTSSEEHGFYQGLNLLPGHVKRFPDHYRVPHMGWNWLSYQYPHPLFRGLDEGYVYFVHSYYVDAANAEDVIATTDYHQEVPAIVAHGHIIGMQFHPEKSGEIGMALLKQFTTMRRK